MTLFSKLFGTKGTSRDDQIALIIDQATAVLESNISLESHKKFTKPIEALWIELFTANPKHSSIRMQAVMCAVAQYIGMHTWLEYNDRLAEKELISLAQAVLIIELANQFFHLTPGGELRELVGRIIVEQSLALQVSSPVSICSMGQEQVELAYQMVAESKRVALLPDDESLSEALQNM